jgi:hypothetical protein
MSDLQWHWHTLKVLLAAQHDIQQREAPTMKATKGKRADKQSPKTAARGARPVTRMAHDADDTRQAKARRVEIASIYDRSLELLTARRSGQEVRWTFRGEDENGRPVDVVMTFYHGWISHLAEDLIRASRAVMNAHLEIFEDRRGRLRM